ncbi:hypothetical protein M9Y10_003372 [Tritrichomonas musculus]|uniref:F5/8 type C domain-containing protein n=1 Tax=Tritrichomonas musculus TaxID=1915356 RepID=A0ABR2JPI4_9EUKA
MRLKTSSIAGIPFQSYDDFTFIVNGAKFKTTRIVSDLLSQKICMLHQFDPTFDEITIDTNEKGDFSQFLKLINFKVNNIPESELPFISEVIEKLGANTIEIQEEERIILTNDNVFDLLKIHEKSPNFFSRKYQNEVDFVSSHFYELYNSKNEELKEISKTTLDIILQNSKLQIESEDQLLTFLNDLNRKDSSYPNMYEHVNFSNVTSDAIKEFLVVFNAEKMTRDTWNKISIRLSQEVIPTQKRSKRKVKKNTSNESEAIEVKFEGKDELNGILNLLRKRFNEYVFAKVNISSSSMYLNDVEYSALNVIDYDDANKEFCSKDMKNSWLRFDFKDRQIKVTAYTIRSFFGEENDEHPKSWVIEGSNDNNDWEEVDVQSNCGFLNGENKIHTFLIKESNQKPFKFIRMRLTSENWSNTNCLDINCIDFYGKLF